MPHGVTMHAEETGPYRDIATERARTGSGGCQTDGIGEHGRELAASEGHWVGCLRQRRSELL